MRARLLLASALSLFLVEAAPAQFVHPSAYSSSLGGANNAWPFAYTNGAGSYQQSYEAAQFPGPITIAQLGFRYFTDTVRSGGPVDCQISLSYSAVPFNALSSTFASNVGAGSTIVFDGIATVLP